MATDDYSRADFAHSPMLVFYEVTRACDLACRHCRACAEPRRDPQELDTSCAKRLLDQLTSFPRPPLLVFTGGDPLKRQDIFELIEHGRSRGLTVAITPSATPLVTAEAISRLLRAGISLMAVSLDGADAITHDAFRGFEGSYDRVFQILADARAIGLPTQVNTTITRRNVHQVDAMANLLAGQGIVLWSVFFLIPVGRGALEQRISPPEYEQVFAKLWTHAQRQPYAIKTTEAQHYRRFVLQLGGRPGANPAHHPHLRRPRAPLGINDGNGVMFVGHTGQILPSGFLPLECGRFPRDSVVDVYQHSPVFRRLRDASSFTGKCGVCEYRHVCGGSRARTYAVCGDAFASEPDCDYHPQAWQDRQAAAASLVPGTSVL